jgi:hypothetical protein
MPLYALLAAYGIPQRGRSVTLTATVVLFVIWTWPALRIAHMTVSPPVAAIESIRAEYAPGSKNICVDETLAAHAHPVGGALAASHTGTADERLVALLDEARRLGDPRTLGSALVARHYVLWDPEGLEERLALSQEIVEAGRRSRDLALRFQGLLSLVSDRLELGDIVGAKLGLEEQRECADALQLPLFRCRLHGTPLRDRWSGSGRA